MRIGMMVDTYKPYVSGITNYIDMHKRILESEGHEVYVFTFGDLDYQDDEPHVVRSPGLPLADTGYYLSLRYKTEHKKLLHTMDVVHVHHPFLSGRLALNYCRRPQIPIVFTNHTRYDLYAQARVPFMPKEISQGLLQAYMPEFCDAVDLVTSPSNGMQGVLQHYGVKCHIEVVRHGINLLPFHNAEPLLRSDFGFSQADLLLVYTGRIAPEKNLKFLVQSFAGVAQVFPHVHLLILGGGQKQFEDELKQVPAQLGIQDRVHFFGMIAYDQLPSYLAMCDVFVTASVSEVNPLSVIEGMAVGLPVMGIDSPGVSDSVIDRESGLIATNDLASFTAKLTYLCADSVLRKQMGQAAREASNQYDMRRTTMTMLGHYMRLCQSTKPIKQSFDERLKSVLEEFLK